MSKNKKTLYIVLGISVASAILILAGVFVFHKIYYGSRWYRNTKINGVDVSGQTLKESEKTILNDIGDYKLKITGREHGSLVIDGKEINYRIDVSKQLKSLFDEEHKGSAVFTGKNSLETDYDVKYDKDKLKEIVSSAKIVTGDAYYKIQKPVDATVEYSEEDKQFRCVEENPGNQIIEEHFIRAIDDMLAKAENEMDLTDEKSYPDVYEAPEIISTDDVIQTELNMCNKAALRYIVWNMGEGVKEMITPAELSKWIKYKNGKIKYREKAIENWVEEFCLKYKTVGKTRHVKMHNGKVVKVKGGDYGWQIDYEKTVSQAKKAIKEEIDQKVIDTYIADPSEENKTAITLKRKVKYVNTAFKKDYETFEYDWDEENFIEISLSEQKVYIIRNGKVKFSCKTISGRPTPDRETRKGAYFIKEHNEKRVLVGEDYATPVTKWVRIMWTGTGFHTANWQKWSNWTPDYYKTHGSHGCLNLSAEDAAMVYKLSKYREAVFIY